MRATSASSSAIVASKPGSLRVDTSASAHASGLRTLLVEVAAVNAVDAPRAEDVEFGLLRLSLNPSGPGADHESQGYQDRTESEGRLCRRIAGQSPLPVLRGQGGRRRLQRCVGGISLDPGKREPPCPLPPPVTRSRWGFRHRAAPPG